MGGWSAAVLVAGSAARAAAGTANSVQLLSIEPATAGSDQLQSQRRHKAETRKLLAVSRGLETMCNA